jgi:hypothetical protein
MSHVIMMKESVILSTRRPVTVVGTLFRAKFEDYSTVGLRPISLIAETRTLIGEPGVNTSYNLVIGMVHLR